MCPIHLSPTLSVLPVILKTRYWYKQSKKLEGFKKKYLKDIEIAKASVVSGTHYRQILDYAKAEGIDFIIMGTGKRRQKMMFGSVADKVSRLAKIPVMLIKYS
jgi:nucleotide-binding universal stress UspA family protein